MRVTVHLRIEGRVQGVGYRFALDAEANARKLGGWVRNRRDGSVEAVLQGDAADVDSVIAWARRGPSAARVSAVHVEPASGEANRPYPGFNCLPTT